MAQWRRKRGKWRRKTNKKKKEKEAENEEEGEEEVKEEEEKGEIDPIYQNHYESREVQKAENEILLQPHKSIFFFSFSSFFPFLFFPLLFF